MSDIIVGDRVKPSYAALQSLRDSWLNAGTHEKKTQCKKWLEDKAAKRGTIESVLSNKYCSRYFGVKWDDGSYTETSTSLVEKVVQ